MEFFVVIHLHTKCVNSVFCSDTVFPVCLSFSTFVLLVPFIHR